jgi:hypothetical protein
MADSHLHHFHQINRFTGRIAANEDNYKASERPMIVYWKRTTKTDDDDDKLTSLPLAEGDKPCQ